MNSFVSVSVVCLFYTKSMESPRSVCHIIRKPRKGFNQWLTFVLCSSSSNAHQKVKIVGK